MELLILPILYCLLITHLNERNRRQYFSQWLPCFGFFGWSYYNRITRNPMVEKPGAQNIIACENQGKKHELSDPLK